MASPSGRNSKLKTVWNKAKSSFHSSKSKSQGTASTASAEPDGKIDSVGPSNLTSAVSLPRNSISTLTPTESISRPIAELWDEAYEELSLKKKNNVIEYESILSRTLVGALAGGQVSATALSGLGSVQRSQQLKVLLEKMIKEVEDGAWKLKFRGHDLRVKDLVTPVVGVLEWAKDFVGDAVEVSPYASLAWSGVCLLLPLVLNPTQQAAAQVKALEEISTIISRCNLREELYRQRYESDGYQKSKGVFRTSHSIYRDALKALYVMVLDFQITSVCYLSKPTFFKGAGDVVKWNDWDLMLAAVRDHVSSVTFIEAQWRDMKLDEENKLLLERHEQRMRGLDAIKEEVTRMKEVFKNANKSSERQEILSWLSQVDPSTSYNYARRKHALSTGDWLVKNNNEFQKWEKEPNSMLWLSGKVGAGKSFLSSIVIGHLETLHAQDIYTAIAYFYFSFSDREKQSTENMLRSIIKQVCGKLPDIPESLSNLRRYREINHQPDLKSLENNLKESIRDFNSVYIVIDALDECPKTNNERERLLKVLENIQTWDSPNLHLLCTSRNYSDIKAKLEPLTTNSAKIIIDLEERRREVDRDIRTYIENEIESSEFRTWPADIKKAVNVALTEKSDGMFQYVALQLKALETARTRSAIEEALKDLPDGLDATYDRALLNINPNHQSLAIRFLEWLAFSVRPLKLAELAEVSVIEPSSFKFDEDKRLFSPTNIFDFLPGLLVYDSAYEPSIRLAHLSIEEYLLSERIRDGPAASYSITRNEGNVHIALTCLSYVLYVSTIKGLENPDRGVLKNFPLWNYAASAWVEHIAEVPKDSRPDQLLHMIKCTLKPRTEPLIKMILTWLAEFNFDYRSNQNQTVSHLSYRAYEAYVKSLAPTRYSRSERRNLNEEDFDIELTDHENQDILKRHVAVIELLFERFGWQHHKHIMEILVIPFGGYSYPTMDPAAKSDLREYWNAWPIPEFSRKTVMWSVQQLKGIVGALCWCHNLEVYPMSNFLYDDWRDHTLIARTSSQRNYLGLVQAESIYYFPQKYKRSSFDEESGILKLADCSLARVSWAAISSSHDDRVSPSYAPPESRLNRPLTSIADMWSLGCLFLEFITWLLLGSDEIYEFSNYRSEVDEYDGIDSDDFYRIIRTGNGEKEAMLKEKVIQWADGLHSLKHCSDVIHGFLDVVLDHLLVVDPQKRMDADSLYRHLSDIVERAENEEGYLLDPRPRHAKAGIPTWPERRSSGSMVS